MLPIVFVCLQPGDHVVYVVASNGKEDSAAVRLVFEILVDIQKWTVTAEDLWFRDDGGKLSGFKICTVSSRFSK
jgi:hypothetical protein